MEKRIVYISPLRTAGINAINGLANSKTILEYLDPIDYHFILFSTLYQSGSKYFQIDREALPAHILANPFWSEKLIAIDSKAYEESSIKANNIMASNYDFDLDKEYNYPQASNLIDYFRCLFYSAETGIPFINAEYVESKNFERLESRFKKEFYVSLQNFLKLIHSESISSITPQYSVLKKDVKRFEEIACSSLFLDYSKSLALLNEEPRSPSIKKDIQSNALKVYSKYASHVDLKSMSFSFLKANKKVVDLFVSKSASILGDYIIDTLEKLTANKRKITFYKVEEAHYMVSWANRVGELMRSGGQDKLKEFLDEQQREQNDADTGLP